MWMFGVNMNKQQQQRKLFFLMLIYSWFKTTLKKKIQYAENEVIKFYFL